MVQLEIVKSLMEHLSDEPITYNKLCRSTKLNPRTVTRHLELIMYIQSQGRVSMKREGFRLKIRKEYA